MGCNFHVHQNFSRFVLRCPVRYAAMLRATLQASCLSQASLLHDCVLREEKKLLWQCAALTPSQHTCQRVTAAAVRLDVL